MGRANPGLLCKGSGTKTDRNEFTSPTATAHPRPTPSAPVLVEVIAETLAPPHSQRERIVAVITRDVSVAAEGLHQHTVEHLFDAPASIMLYADLSAAGSIDIAIRLDAGASHLFPSLSMRRIPARPAKLSATTK